MRFPVRREYKYLGMTITDSLKVEQNVLSKKPQHTAMTKRLMGLFK